MLISWRDTADVLRDLLRRDGLDPDKVPSPTAAWQVFCAFLAVDVAEVQADPDSDADSFIVQWGRYGWHDGLPSLSFSRQLTFDVAGEPEFWQVTLDMVFADDPALADLDQLNTQDSGFYSERPGPALDAALSEVLWEAEQYPALQALWRSAPLRSTVTFDQSC